VGALPAHDAIPLLRMHVQQALEIDPSLPDAQALMGVAAAFYDYDWSEVDRRFRLAFSYEPVPHFVRYNRALYFLSNVGRAREAVEDSERLLKADPLNVAHLWTYAVSLRAARRDAEADARFAQVIEFGVGAWSIAAAIVLSGNHVERGAVPEALAYAEMAYALAPRLPAAIGQLAGMLTRVGQVERSEALIAQLRPGAPFGFAACHLAAGEIDQAVDWLEKAIEQRDMWVLTLLLVGNVGGRVLWSSPRWPKLAKLLNAPVTRNWA
jgi:tetratricopeptide (TPR) repeat protein